MKKLLLLSLIPVTLFLQGAFVMEKGQPLKKVEYTQTEQNTENTPSVIPQSTTGRPSFPSTTVQKPNTPIKTETTENSTSTSPNNASTTTKPIINKPVVIQPIKKPNPTLNSNTPIKILTIGDSFTDGADILKPLKSLFDAKKNHKVSFIGTESDAGIHHEGRGGWSAAGYMNLNKKYYKSPFVNTSDTIDFKYYFKNILKNQPNVVIVQLGVNDVFYAAQGISKGYYSESSIINTKIDHMRQLITKIRSGLDTNSKILLMTPTPPREPLITFRGVKMSLDKKLMKQYNEKLTSMYSNKQSENIYLVDTYNSLNPKTDFKDHVHPTTQGYKKIANTLMKKILELY